MNLLDDIHRDLVYARSLLSDTKRWTQGVPARDLAGNETAIKDGYAFRADAALEFVSKNSLCYPPAMRQVINQTPARHNERNLSWDNPIDINALIDWHDAPTTSHADVIAAFDAAITSITRM